jgi:hypothetical protein
MVLREVGVTACGLAVFQGVDFNEAPGKFTLTLELRPAGASALPAKVGEKL